MKKLKLTALILCTITVLTLLCSCGDSNTMTDSYLLDILDNDILGKSQEEIVALDKNTELFTVKEKDLDDGTHRVKYVFTEEGAHGDAFVSGGKWFTTVNYYFENDELITYEIEYRQSDYSEGMCAKRITMFSEYLTEKYGEPADENEWNVAGGILDMARQNGGWVLFTYEANA